MVVSDEILQAAQELGAALRQTPQMQDYLSADAALRGSAEVVALEAQVMGVFHQLTSRQQAGETLTPKEIASFYQIRNELANHPLVVRRDQCLEAVKALFAQAGATLSSVLTVDYSSLVLD